jgi:alkylation response protein AidB-like acyl-CoA dehydrogenase
VTTIERQPHDPPVSASLRPAGYAAEHVDRLPFGTPEKSKRYATERFHGATGLNWYTCDPSLQFLMRYYLTPEELAWAEPHLERLGALIGGPVSERADITDKNPPRLVKYDRWGHDISEVVIPESAQQTKRDLIAARFSNPAIQEGAQRAGVRLDIPGAAYGYMLNQAEIGMACALGTGHGMIAALVNQFASPAIRDWVMPRLVAGEFDGATAQMLTERTGGSDLGALETTATPDGDAWLLNGFKWFASNADGSAYVVLAKPVGAPDSVKGVCTFLVLKERRDGSRNGVRIRQLKDKLGTRAVASCEVEFDDAEAFLLSGDPTDGAGGDGQGLSRMMQMTNGSRIGVAMMGLGCARRALTESLCYAAARTAFGKPLIDQPLMRRKLAEMIVDVEAAQALVFDGHGVPNRLQEGSAVRRLRLAPAVIKLRAARLGITAASDAVEIHGGNGYVETWPVARILRDAQNNTIWEGADNILCLDIRRAIEREEADVPFIGRLREAVDNAGEDVPTARVVSRRIDDLVAAIDVWKSLDRTTAEARLFPLGQFMVDVYAGALLVEQAAWEQREIGGDRKALVARLYAARYLADPGPLRGIDAPNDEVLARFDDLIAGALVDERPR